MSTSTFYAHISEDKRYQTVPQHCRNAANYAASALENIGLFNAGYLAALLHDMGKHKTEFTEYLLDAVIRQKPVKRGSVNHTFAGVRFILENWHHSEDLSYSDITAELLAFAIGSHHGLFDCVDEKRESGFSHRKAKDGIGYEEAKQNFLSQCADSTELNSLFFRATEEMTPILMKISELPQQQDDALANSEIYFYIGLLGRMLLSSVIEGDRRDTAEFLNSADYPQWPSEMRPIWADCLDRVEHKLEAFSSSEPIQQARQAISNQCRAFAEQPGGIYRLNVPTGGGKTLSSLRYALAHAGRWNKSRVLFVTPLLSILDQNAQVIREYISDDRLILEHHSNLVKTENEDEQLDNRELLTENWNSPIVITTLVQLLNTIYSGKTSAIRRFHALCNSIIVIDEVQTVPTNMLTLFNLAVNFLAHICGATVVLCSATQPSLETVPHPLLQSSCDMVPWQEALWAVFKRTEIRDAGCCRLEELPERIESSLAHVDSLLVICNKKEEAAFVYQALSQSDILCFHLSAAMCTAHRRESLQALTEALEKSKKGGQKVLCVSTQVIEAGVDISFARVIRLSAGMDSIIQAAGRCNRHGENSPLGTVCIIQCLGEKLSHLEDIRRGQKATIALLDAYKKTPERFRYDLAGNEAIEFYFRCLYQSMDPGFQDDAVGEYGSIFDLLADNQKYADDNCAKVNDYFLRQAFQLAGSLFQVFDQDTVDVIVPYGKGYILREDLIAASEKRGGWDYAHIATLLDQAKPYCVSLYKYQVDQLNQQGALIPLFDKGTYALTDGFYDKQTGFSLKKGTTSFWEV